MCPSPKSWTQRDPGAKHPFPLQESVTQPPRFAPPWRSGDALLREPRGLPSSQAKPRDARDRWPVSKIAKAAWTCRGTRHRERHGAWRSNSRRRAKRRSACRERCGEPGNGRGPFRDEGDGLRLGERAGRGCVGNGDLLGKSYLSSLGRTPFDILMCEGEQLAR